MKCIIKFNIVITCPVVFKIKYIYIITLFAYCTTNIIPLTYSNISPNWEARTNRDNSSKI